MAYLSSTCLFAALFLFAIIHTGETFECYVCDKNNTGCNDPFDTTMAEKYTETCPTGTTTCIKVVNPKEDDVSYRMCGTTDACDDYSRCFICKEGLCNSSISVIPAFGIIGLISLIVVNFLN